MQLLKSKKTLPVFPSSLAKIKNSKTQKFQTKSAVERLTHLIQNLILWEKLTLHRMVAVISQTQVSLTDYPIANDYQNRPQTPQPNPQKL